MSEFRTNADGQPLDHSRILKVKTPVGTRLVRPLDGHTDFTGKTDILRGMRCTKDGVKWGRSKTLANGTIQGTEDLVLFDAEDVVGEFSVNLRYGTLDEVAG
tara:strand:- start:148 stop:453 length:306 start_codon:yes stop_codon:yes gene_type:complete